MPRRRLSSLAVCATFASGLVAGCSSAAPTPKPLASSTTSSATPSSSPAPSVSSGPPALPAAARGHTDASARAFVRYWVDMLNFSGPAGDTRGLRGLSTSACEGCDAIADAIDSVAHDGGSIAGRGWTVTSFKKPTTSSRFTTLSASVLVHPQAVTVKRGAKVRHFTGGDRVKVFKLIRRGASWQVDNLDQSSR